MGRSGVGCSRRTDQSSQRKDGWSVSRLIDLTGQKFHYLTVLERAENTKDGKTQWLCQCVCGRKTVVAASDLKRKRYSTKSCGCMSSSLIAKARKTHGMSHHPAWGVWHSMKQRCMDPNHPAYHNYGGRGITVCQEWLDSFETFWADMGPTYQRGMDLDRINNNGGYHPGNCRWVSRKINSRNKRDSRMVDSSFGRITVAELSEKTGIGVTTLLYRLDHNWPAKLLCIPPDLRNKSTTSGIVVRGTDLQYTIQNAESCEL